MYKCPQKKEREEDPASLFIDEVDTYGSPIGIGIHTFINELTEKLQVLNLIRIQWFTR